MTFTRWIPRSFLAFAVHSNLLSAAWVHEQSHLSNVIQGRWKYMQGVGDPDLASGWGRVVNSLNVQRRKLLGHQNGEKHDNRPNAQGNPTCGHIDGEIIQFNEPERLPTECFMGFNHSNCSVVQGSHHVGKPEWNQDHFHKAPMCAHMCSKANTINTINGDKMRVRRDVHCAATNNEVMETSEFFLMTRQGLPHNVYGYEFRFRRKAVELDETIIRCPLRRTACTYTNSGDLLDCQTSNDDTYLAGYHVNVEVKEAFRDLGTFPAVDDDLVDDVEYPSKWWSVVSCEAIVEEVTTPPRMIYESVKFFWTPRNYVYGYLQLSLYILAGIVFFYLCWTYYFAGQCIVCNRKMMFLSKKPETLDLCLVCRCLGAEMPHPEIAARLRRDKAKHHNGRLMRGAFADVKQGVTKPLGIHQAPPMTCRTMVYLIRDFFTGAWFTFKRYGWWLLSIFSCGRYQRHRRPNTNVVAVAVAGDHGGGEDDANGGAGGAGGWDSRRNSRHLSKVHPEASATKTSTSSSRNGGGALVVTDLVDGAEGGEESTRVGCFSSMLKSAAATAPSRSTQAGAAASSISGGDGNPAPPRVSRRNRTVSLESKGSIHRSNSARRSTASTTSTRGREAQF